MQDGRAPLNHPLAVRYYEVRALEARRGWLPSSFTYSPHIRNDPAALEPAPAPAAALPAVSWEDMLRRNGVTYGQDVSTGQLVSDDRLHSLLVGGIPGSGKTTFTALLVAQLVQQGARISLGDPHAGHPESLANRLEAMGITPPLEQEPRLIRELVETTAAEIQTRKYTPSTRPVVCVVDELPTQIRLLGDRDRERLREALEIIGFSGRKFAVSVILLAQSWTRAVVGGTAIRNLVPAAAIFRMRRDEALSMSGMRAESWPDDPLNLPPGEAYLVGVGSDIKRIRVPALPAARGLPSQPSQPSQPSPSLPTALPATFGEGNRKAAGRLEPEGRDRRVLDLFMAGASVPEIVQTTYQLSSNDGRRYIAARDQVEAVIRRFTLAVQRPA